MSRITVEKLKSAQETGVFRSYGKSVFQHQIIVLFILKMQKKRIVVRLSRKRILLYVFHIDSVSPTK